ncbi:hypothetical protein BZA77DRAFT_390809 [Pyronema omphalodes]|nr:hypothetical protein BZA77DRAFT_390809 [Pyronema omphalodes]
MHLLSILFTAALVSAQCTPNPIPQINANINTPFAVEVHNASYPTIHNRRLNFWKAGGGDNHLYLSPAGDAISNHTLVAGVLTNTEPTFNNVIIRAVINGEYTARDNTTKIFMTQRGDPRAYFDVYDGCNPDTGAPQMILRLRNGDKVCVRRASGLRDEFRYSGNGNTLDAGCVHVDLGVVVTPVLVPAVLDV